MAHCIAPDTQWGYVWYVSRICLVRPSQCGLCGAHAVAVGVIAQAPVMVSSACAELICINVIAQAPVMVSSACAGLICINVIKRRIAIALCTYAHMHICTCAHMHICTYAHVHNVATGYRIQGIG